MFLFNRKERRVFGAKKRRGLLNLRYFQQLHNYKLFTNLFNPSTNLKTLKFINNPSLQPESLR